MLINSIIGISIIIMLDTKLTALDRMYQLSL